MSRVLLNERREIDSTSARLLFETQLKPNTNQEQLCGGSYVVISSRDFKPTYTKKVSNYAVMADIRTDQVRPDHEKFKSSNMISNY
jgi:hypothetical protein